MHMTADVGTRRPRIAASPYRSPGLVGNNSDVRTGQITKEGVRTC
jgi:hypothetical protein